MFAGFGTAEDTNLRFKELLRNGGTGLSTAFDMPTLMGRDSDSEWSLGEVGRAGVAVDTLADMEDLFADIDLSQVSTSMTINGPAATLLAMYVAVAEQTGVEPHQLAGTIQNDILKEYQAQKEYIYPPRPSMRIVTDMVKYTTAEMPKWHPISISGYHIREEKQGSSRISIYLSKRVLLRRSRYRCWDKTLMSLGNASVSSLITIAISLKKSVNSEQTTYLGTLDERTLRSHR